MAPRERVIVALDLPSVAVAETLVGKLGDSISFYKIGYQLGYAGGLSFAQDLIAVRQAGLLRSEAARHRQHREQGRREHRQFGRDLPHRACLSADHEGRARRRRGSKLKILAVTILTSYNDSDVTEAGYVGSAREQVKKKSAAGLRARHRRHRLLGGGERDAAPAVGPDRLLVTPGIRPAGAETGDQKRIMTPAAAIRAGSDYLVVGRPITGVADPKAAADAIVREVAQATKA